MPGNPANQSILADETGDTTSDKVRLVAESEDINFKKTVLPKDRDGHLGPYFEHAHWSADGTTILTTSSDRRVSAYVVPQDLLEPHRSSPLTLTPQSTLFLGERTNVLASAPYFNVAEAYSTQVLVSSTDHPIQLFCLSTSSQSSLNRGNRNINDNDDDLSSTQTNPVPPNRRPVASYPMIKSRTEDFLTASSLIWSYPGTHFIAGARSFLARFDLSRTGEPPLWQIKTIPSERHIAKGNGIGMRGTVSALSTPPRDTGSGLVAAGTWNRWVGLYDFDQAGTCVATWGIASAAAEARRTEDGDDNGIGGEGIMQTIWSPCGRYLLVSERRSRGILVYDVRVTGRLLGWLADREAANTCQRINCDIFASSSSPGAPSDGGAKGFEVWSGTTDGSVKVWEGVGSSEGALDPAWEWCADTQSTVGATCLHQSGTVIATCSGSWDFDTENGSDSSESDDSDDEEKDTDSEREEGFSGQGSVKSLSSKDSQRGTWMQRQSKGSRLKIWSLAVNEG